MRQGADRQFAIVFGVLAQGGNWEASFIVAAVLLVAGSAVWAFWLDPKEA